MSGKIHTMMKHALYIMACRRTRVTKTPKLPCSRCGWLVSPNWRCKSTHTLTEHIAGGTPSQTCTVTRSREGLTDPRVCMIWHGMCGLSVSEVKG